MKSQTIDCRQCAGRWCENRPSATPGCLEKARELKDARAALHAATEAVAKARDAVVETARIYTHLDPDDDAMIASVAELEEAEQHEDEARARLEALR